MSMLTGAIRFAAGTIAGLGAGKIIENAIKATTPETLSKFDKVIIKAGTFVLAAMIGLKADAYVTNYIDGVTKSFKDTASVLAGAVVNLADQADPIVEEDIESEILTDDAADDIKYGDTNPDTTK